MPMAPTTEELLTRLAAGRRLKPLKAWELRALITEMYQRSKRAHRDAQTRKNYGGLAQAYRNIAMIAKAIAQAMPDDRIVQARMQAIVQVHGRAHAEADIARLIMTPRQRAIVDRAINGAMVRGASDESLRTGGQRRRTARVLPGRTRTRRTGGGSRAAA